MYKYIQTFLYPTASILVQDPPSFLSSGSWDLFNSVKLPKSETDQSLPSKLGVQYPFTITFTPSVRQSVAVMC